MGKRKNRKAKRKFQAQNVKLKDKKIELGISLFSLIIAGIALYFAWQANRISQNANLLMLRQLNE